MDHIVDWKDQRKDVIRKGLTGRDSIKVANMPIQDNLTIQTVRINEKYSVRQFQILMNAAKVLEPKFPQCRLREDCITSVANALGYGKETPLVQKEMQKLYLEIKPFERCLFYVANFKQPVFTTQDKERLENVKQAVNSLERSKRSRRRSRSRSRISDELDDILARDETVSFPKQKRQPPAKKVAKVGVSGDKTKK